MNLLICLLKNSIVLEISVLIYTEMGILEMPIRICYNASRQGLIQDAGGNVMEDIKQVNFKDMSDIDVLAAYLSGLNI